MTWHKDILSWKSIFLSVGLLLGFSSSSWALLGAGDIVFDPAAYAQLITTYGVTVQQYQNQIQQLQNQFVQLQNQARNLVNLNWQVPLTGLNQVGQIMQNANGIASSFARAQSQFQKLYPDAGAYTGMTGSQYVNQASLWQNQTRNAAQDTMNIQAELRDAFTADQMALNNASSRSASAQGTRDAIQATNQLLALLNKQLMQLQLLIASTASGDASYAAERASKAAAGNAYLQNSFQEWSSKGPRNIILNNDLLH